QAYSQVGGLGGDVQAVGDSDAPQRVVLDEFLANDLQDFHRLVRPIDALLALIGQIEILNVAIHLRSSRRHDSPSGVSKIKTFYPPSAHEKAEKSQLLSYGLCDGLAETGVTGQPDGFIRGFPGEVRILAAEVAVSGGLLVNRTAQIQ